MDSFDISIYLGEAATQCQFALAAARHFNNALNKTLNKPRDNSSDATTQGWDWHREVFVAIHSLLTHASNVSKIFWPAGDGRDEATRKRLERAKELRAYIGLPDDNHFLKDRKLRNHLEHFDERLDQWRETRQHRHYVQDIIAPKGAIAGIEEKYFFRWYDQNTRRFIFRGEPFDIQALVTAIGQLLPLAVEGSDRATREMSKTNRQ